MTKIEALELELAARKLVDGTCLDWWSVIKRVNTTGGFKFQPHFDSPRKVYELALGIVEGKPVWSGDTLYWNSQNDRISSGYVVIDDSHDLSLLGWTWNPPKPKTVMVEMGVRLAELYAAEGYTDIPADEWMKLCCARDEACRKALKELK